MIVIRNGFIVDGLGRPGYTGDVLIEHERVAAVLPSAQTQTDYPSAHIIDARGKTVCPGFIDIHRHFDTAVFDADFGALELRQGLTTCCCGNCGMAPVPNRAESRAQLQNYLAPCLGSFKNAPFSTHAEYAARLLKTALPVNVGFFAGMGAIRIAAKGFDAAPYTPAQMDRARGLLRDALDAGALGLSIGLMYVPELYSSPEEIAALASEVRGRGILCAHMRSETSKLAEAVAEVITVAKKAEVPLEISHFKAAGVDNWHKTLNTAIELIEKERAGGADITVDFYPYDCGSSTMMQMLPPSFLADGAEKALASLDKPQNVEKLRRLLASGEPGWDNLSRTIGWDRTIISAVSLPEHQIHTGKTVTEAAQNAGLDEAAFVAALMRAENGKVSIINRSMSQEDIDTIARLPYSSLISDALYGDKKKAHPRLFGAFPKFLRDFVFERRVLPLETAIQKMTAAPAARLGLRDRGILKVGQQADILIFDNTRFRDKASFSDPAQEAEGLSRVFVNGQSALEEDQLAHRNTGVTIRL